MNLIICIINYLFIVLIADKRIPFIHIIIIIIDGIITIFSKSRSSKYTIINEDGHLRHHKKIADGQIHYEYIRWRTYIFTSEIKRPLYNKNEPNNNRTKKR